jgi:hypothetical protein
MEEILKNIYHQFILSNSRFRSTFQVPKQHEHSAISGERMKEYYGKDAHRELVDKISIHNPFKKIYEDHRCETYEVDILVIDIENFKSIVEGAIALMPEDVINKIRTNK